MGCLVRDHTTLLLIFTILLFIYEEISANQLDVAKKYGKRFGNKNKLNSTIDIKDINKSVTKSEILSPEPTKVPESVKLEATESLNRYNSYINTELTTPFDKDIDKNVESISAAEPEQEVDVDLSQLQVSLPNVKFDCSGRQEGYYGDPDYRCEVFHYCNGEQKRDTFLCPSNSKFNQKDMTCDTDSGEELCQSEPVWGQNHLYPSSVQHISTVNNPIEKNQFEVTAPKYETKENGFKEPIYETKTYDNIRKSATKNENKINYNEKGNSNDNNKPNDSSDDTNTEIKFHYFGGNFGERNTLNTNNDNNRKNTNLKNNNNNKIENYSDFGTVSDANKKGYKEEKENNPVVIQSSQSSDSNNKKQSFTPTNYQKSVLNTVHNKPQDMNPIHNKNSNKNYEFSQSEHYLPSSPPEKSYLSPPMPTEKASSVPPIRITSYTQRQKPEEFPIYPLAPSITLRPAIKWPNRKQIGSESYTNKIIKLSESQTQHQTPPPPPPPPTPPQTIRRQKNQARPQIQTQIQPQLRPQLRPQIQTQIQPQLRPQIQTQIQPQLRPQMTTYKQIEKYKEQPQQNVYKESPKIYEIPIDLWTQNNDNKDDYQPVIVEERPSPDSSPQPSKSNKQRYHSQQNLMEEKPQQNWENFYQKNSELSQNNAPQHQTKTPIIKTYNTIDQYQSNSGKDHYFLNNNREPVYQNNGQLNQNSWSAEIKGEQNSPQIKELPNNHKLQNLLQRPKWAQEVLEMSDLPQYNSQQPIQQLSQPQKTLNDFSPNSNLDSNLFYNINHNNNNNNINKNNNKNNNNNNKNSEKQVLTDGGYDIRDNTRDNTKIRETSGIKPATNLFYEQFRPYKFAENNMSYKRKPTEDKPVKHIYIEDNPKNDDNNNQYESQMSLKGPISVEDLKYVTFEPPPKQISTHKMSGYVPEVLPQTEPISHSKVITKPQKPLVQNSAKNNVKLYKPKKQQFFNTANIVDELLSGENGWTLKQFDTPGLENTFSNNYPISALRPRPKIPKIPKRIIPPQLMTHFQHNVSPIRFPYHPQSQSSIIIPQQLPFNHNLQAQHTFPMHYYLPYYPMTAQSHKPINHLRMRSPSHPRLWK